MMNIYFPPLCPPHLCWHRGKTKSAGGCGGFQGLTQFSHCIGLKWVSVTKASLYLSRAEPRQLSG